MNPDRRHLLVPVAVLIAVMAVVSLVTRGSGAGEDGVAGGDGSSTTTSTTRPPPTTTTSTTPPTTIPAGPPTLVVTPEDDLAAMAAANPPETTFVLASGIHRGGAITPRDGQIFTGRPGAVMSGAVVLTSFNERDGLWSAEGQPTEGRVHGQCDPDSPRCAHSEDLFIDDAVLHHVGSVGEVGPGSWHFDYPNDTVYLGDDPTGRVVELSAEPYAFHGDADGVTISGLVIEKYAVPAQEGTIDSRRDRDDLIGGADWTITDNVVRWNHGVGIAATTGAVVRGNTVYENGQLGLAAKGAGVTFEDNEIYGNNTAGFSAGWEAGGSKFAFTSGLVVRNNYVHDNHGVGLWTDIDNIDTLYEGNRVIDNERMGIFHEISYDAVITGNEVRGNGFGFDAWVWGAGIIVSTSVNVEVVGNTVEGNADGIIGVQQDRSDAPASFGELSLVNLAVHENLVAGNGGWTGIGQDVGSNEVFTDLNNRFFDNSYQQEGLHFFWLNEERTFEEWVEFGLG
ncbi:MAG: right-handed parallel beta-helix repeat-containing protein [Acidimicrobiia bacterium]